MVGQTISHYKILGKLGEGGMGVVYKAEDIKLKRKVALKFPPVDQLASEEARVRFLREAQAAAALNHPNICTVHEIDEANGRTFIAMELVEGETVKDKARSRPRPLEEALDLTIQAAQGLQAAHQEGITHRDIKSANLMVTPRGRLKVMDFGLAQVGDLSQLTKTGTTLGTAAYMSPEQAQAQPTDRRTDIWSLGVVLYEMLTGQLPFRGEVAAAVAFAVVNSEPEPLTALRSGLPIELDHIVGKALAKEPRERYQHIEDLLVDLRALRKGVLNEIRATAPARSSRRNLVFAGAGLLAVLLALSLALNLDLVRDRILGGSAPAPIASIVVLPLANLTGDPGQEYFVDGMTDALITNLSKIGALTVISRTTAMRYKATDKPLPEIARELNVDVVVDGSVVREGARVRVAAQLINAASGENLWAESYERDLSSILALQGDVARAIAGSVKITLSPEEEDRLTSSRQVSPETYEAYLRGMFWLNRGTPEGIEKGMSYLHEAVEKDPGDPLAYAGLALGYITVAHGPEPPSDALAHAKSAALKSVRLDDTLAEAHAALAFLQGYYEWDWGAARRTLDHALEINPNLAIAHYHDSWFHVLFGRMEEAIVAHKRAQELDPLMPMHTAWLGGLYVYDGRYEEAVNEARKSIEIAPNFPVGHYILALVHKNKGEYEEAVAAHKKAAEAAPPWKWSLGSTLVAAGRRDEARKLLAELENETVTPWRAFWLAELYTALGQKDAAFRCLNSERVHAWVPWVRVIPEFQALRDDPRFSDLLRRMNLPPI